MEPLKTEAVGHITYGPHEPTAFMLSGTRSSLIHEALDMAVTAGADLIVAENVPGGHRTYLDSRTMKAD